MFSVKRLLILFFMIVIIGYNVNAIYVETNKDTKLPPDETTIVPLNKEGYTLLQENENYEYYYKAHNGILAVYDKRNGYTWKSGIDHDYDSYIEAVTELFIENNPDATDEEILAIAKPFEEQLNDSREGIANSLIVLEYVNRLNVSRPSVQAGSSFKQFIIAPDLENPGQDSVQERVANSVRTDDIKMVNNDPNHYRIDFKFKAVDIEVRVHLHFSKDGFAIEIKDEELDGDDLDLLISISLAPFMASNGGKLGEPRVETRNMGTEEEPIWEKRVRWDQPTISKTRYPGYILVPDGSGALIRFSDYEASLNGYTGTVYGQDVSQNQTQYTRETNMVPVKQPVMPLFGVSYGDGTQAAFISYTTKGAEYMQIYARPRNSADSYNLTDYQIAHTRYLYNRLYTQVYNQSGAGYQSLFEERNHFDIYQQFDFLAGDGSSLANPYSADYVGMARKYRDHLIQTGALVPKSKEEVNVPIRIDFLMSDAKKSLVGTEDVVVTNIYQVRDILTDLQNNGVYNINSGLLGYQKGGVTLGRKNEPEWSDSIGSKNAFQSVVNELKEQGIDVSLYQNYTTLYEENNLLIGNATKHVGGWYNEYLYSRVTGPVEKQYFAIPSVAASWMNNNIYKTHNMGFISYTIDGISNRLYSHYYSSTEIMSVTDTINIYQEAFANMDSSIVINAVTPNQYLWKYVDRYLNTPMFSSQHLIESDTVPFLQIVLQGSMESYATYSNFSFYQPKDILRMIDYNTYPSFVLTNDPSYKLVATHSSNYYSTEYQLYSEMIKDIYETVNSALAPTINDIWTSRTVLAPGVIVNGYYSGLEIVINYTDNPYTYKGVEVAPISFGIIV